MLVVDDDLTATGLSWVLERLTRHPALLARAVHAARAGSAFVAPHVRGDDYLDAVAKETPTACWAPP